MTKIYLIRHAEAEGNFYRRIQGQYDGHITRRGFTQIDALAERLRDIKIDALYSSDLTRTKTTAGAVLRYHDLILNTEPRLREIFMGEWEDLPWGNA
ncbi:MAG: histidine phosphatase family protein, partial [Oscillospiraceae bacterium]